MKLKSIEELKDGMWCRLANGEVHTITKNYRRPGYEQALIDMGAEWFPPIPEGYRLATAEDRKGRKPDDAMFTGENVTNWCGVEPGRWADCYEYIVPEKHEPKVVHGKVIKSGFGHYRTLVDFECYDEPFEPGDRVEVRKVGA